MQKSANCAYFYGEQTSIEQRDRLVETLDKQATDQIEMLLYKKNPFRDITPLKTPLEDDETSRGLSKFARLARSVTRNRSVIQPHVQSQQQQSASILASCSSSSRTDACPLPNRLQPPPTSLKLGGPVLGTPPSSSSPLTFSGRCATATATLEVNRPADAERGQLNMSSWLDLIPSYKQEAPKTPPNIILHYVAFKTTWDWLILFLTGYTAVMVPFNAVFKDKNIDDVLFLTVDSAVDVIFFIDIVLNFHTTFVAANGDVVSDPKVIRINYLKSWFLVDLLSCLPYDVFNALQPEANKSAISSLFGALKVVRLLRIGRVTRKLDQYLEYMAASLLLMISGFVLLAHWLACAWYKVGYDDVLHGHFYGWLPRLFNDSQDARVKLTQWNASRETKPFPVTKKMTYVTSLYYTLSLITSIGFGNVSATTLSEKILSVFFMLIGAFGYATIFGNVTTIFQGMYATRSRYDDMMGSVKDFVKTHSVPNDLAERVVDYVTSTWAITKGIDTAKVLNYCPKDMKADLCIHLNRMVFNEHPAFRLASDGCLRALAVNFTTVHTAPGDLIFHQGESIDQLCFVVAGSLEVIQDDEIVAFLGRGDVFGEHFWKDPAGSMSHSTATVRALTYCDLHCIRKDNLLKVLSFYSAFAHSFARNLVLTYDLKTRLIFRKIADVRHEFELAERRQAELPLTSLRPDHPVRRMINRFRMLSSVTGGGSQLQSPRRHRKQSVGSDQEEESEDDNDEEEDKDINPVRSIRSAGYGDKNASLIHRRKSTKLFSNPTTISTMNNKAKTNLDGFTCKWLNRMVDAPTKRRDSSPPSQSSSTTVALVEEIKQEEVVVSVTDLLTKLTERNRDILDRLSRVGDKLTEKASNVSSRLDRTTNDVHCWSSASTTSATSSSTRRRRTRGNGQAVLQQLHQLRLGQSIDQYCCNTTTTNSSSSISHNPARTHFSTDSVDSETCCNIRE